ncbi:FG-GAP repeat domain-containing protein [Streptomyces goshikiensis]|uniref:FG-GAP repeat domain-containing protein n=1 Tax=Streptomyces goshikiensis TaxID=1942 RepID=UPI003686D086
MRRAYLPGTDELWMVNERPEERMAYRTAWPTPPALAGLVNLTAGDFTADRKQDIVGIEATTGRLWLYPGGGNGTLAARIQIGSGWNGMNHLAAGDFNADGRSDLLALETATGTLRLYPGTGALTGMNTLGTRTRTGTNWDSMRQLTGGDFNGDGKGDLAAVEAPATTTGNSSTPAPGRPPSARASRAAQAGRHELPCESRARERRIPQNGCYVINYSGRVTGVESAPSGAPERVVRRMPCVGRVGVAVSKCQGHVQAMCVWCAGDCDGNVRFW